MNLPKTLMISGICVLLSSIHIQATTDMPRVSIITSLFKGTEFLQGFMEDIVQQTIFDQCELIIINAASPEREQEEIILAPFLKQYNNIRYFQLDHDPGLFGVWNYGIQLARAPYLTNANIDDRLKFDCYEVHTAYLDEHPEIDLVYSGCYMTSVANETFYNNSSQGKVVWHSMQPFDRIKQLYKWIPYVNNHPMWRKTMHERYGLFNTSYKATGGMEFWVRATLCGNAQYTLIPEIYSLYYYNPTGISTRPDSLDKIEKKRVIETFTHLHEYYFKDISYLTPSGN